MLRAVLGCALGLLLCGALAADDKKGDEKIDPQKLVGKWEVKEPNRIQVEFTKDGKVTLVATGKGTEIKGEGTYKLDGNKLTTTMKFDDKEQKRTRTILKLTDTDLVSTDEEGKEATLKRVKGK